MIEKLSDILRYLIYEGKNEYVPLKREVALLNNYVDLQLMKKLKAEKNISLNINGQINNQKIAPLLLITIIENCFKHSDVMYNKNAFLSIHLTIQDDLFKFEAKNSFQNKNKSKGVGIDNIQQQLEHYYHNNHQFIIDNNNGIFNVLLTINL